jgi:CubicO group peptidase (beta-lactamase class C family)
MTPSSFLKTLRRLLIATLFFHAAAGHAESPPPTPDLDTLAAAALRSNPGMAVVGRWSDGRTSYGFAPSDPGHAGPRASEHTVFEIGSISKVFTGLLLAQAVERGDLKIDAALGDLKPAGVTLGRDIGALTLRQLVTHQACLPSLPPDLKATANSPNPYAHYSPDRLWAALSAYKLSRPAPCAMDYSNWGVATVAEVLAAHYGKTFAELVRERITAPLKMTETSVADGSDTANLTPGFDNDEKVDAWTFQAFAGAGGIRSTASDMLRFGAAILAGKAGPLGAAAERMVLPLGAFPGGEIGYALFVRGEAGDRLYFHDGLTAGFRSTLAILPAAREVLVVMASNSMAQVTPVVLNLESEHFGAAGGASEASPPAAPTAPVLSDYSGVFRIDDRSAFTFVAQDGALYGRLTGQSFQVLTATGPDAFSLASVGARFAFRRDAQGRVAEVELAQAGARMTGHRTADRPPARAIMEAGALDGYAGKYEAPGPNGQPLRFFVQADGGQLAIKLNDQPMFPVFEIAGRRDGFRYDVVDADVQFERDASGEVVDLVLHQNGEYRAPKLRPSHTR